MARVTSSQAVADYLNALGPNRVRDARPVQVTIGRSTFTGAVYTSVGRYAPDCMAVRRGERLPDEEYTSQRFYLLGTPPRSRKPRGKDQRFLILHNQVFRVPGDDGDWFIGCYSSPLPEKRTAEYDPFGPTFQIMRWDHERDGRRIDWGEDCTRPRRPIIVAEAS